MNDAQPQHHDVQLDSLIRMANQIADNLLPAAANEAEAAGMVASHLRRFWAPAMRAQLIEYAQADGAELNVVARAAVRCLAQ